MAREHVQTAISRGIPPRLVVRRHVLRNAAIPITTVAGITIASLIALSAVVERAFSLNGLGAYLVQAAASKDFAVVQGISLVLVAAFVVTNTIVDLLYALLDPRVALGSRGRSERARRRSRRRAGGRAPPRGSSACGDRRGRIACAIVIIVLAPAGRDVRAAARAARPERVNLTERVRRARPRTTRSASTARAATCSRACSPARARRCSAPLAVVALAIVAGVAARDRRRLARRLARLRDLGRRWTSCSRSPASCWPCSPRPCSAPGLTAAALALAVAYTPYVARVLRGAAVRERAREYIAALEVQGLSAWTICARHLRAQRDPADRRAGHDPVRLRDGRPRRDLVHRPRRAAAAGRTGA